MAYIVSISPQGSFTVPIAIRREFGLTKPAKLKMFVREGKVVIRLKRLK